MPQIEDPCSAHSWRCLWKTVIPSVSRTKALSLAALHQPLLPKGRCLGECSTSFSEHISDWILFNVCVLMSWVFFSLQEVPAEVLIILKAITVCFSSQHSLLTHCQLRAFNWENYSPCWVKCFTWRIPGILLKVISQSFLQLNEVDIKHLNNILVFFPDMFGFFNG